MTNRSEEVQYEPIHNSAEPMDESSQAGIFGPPAPNISTINKKHVFIWATSFVIFFIALGVGLYYAGYQAGGRPVPPKPDRDFSVELRDEISAESIQGFLKYLTNIPHLAGTAQDFEQADWLRKKFLEYGLDRADVVPYKVLLSYPNMTEPNKLYLLNGTDQVLFNTSGRQKPLYSPEESSPLVPPNFNAYSGTGSVEGAGLVYVFYGRESDYDYLEQQGINVSGSIVLARYGKVFRGNIVKLAESKGAIGVILYSDPKDFAQEGRNRTYPDSQWMPGLGVQSGTVYLGNGDPITPFYPSIESAYRIPESEAILPKIPVQPIGYDEAEVLLGALKEDLKAPADWQGNLNMTYYLGPVLKDPQWKIKMVVHTSNKMATIYNTIGILEGKEEPDRYVLMGNHRDAWILGAVDPSSGTAALLEMARAFGKIKKDYNWRPRRSLVFCSWGAEEYGLIGSYEWVEEHAAMLSSRAVAYINVDIAVEGNYSLNGHAAPLLRTLLIDSSKKIPNPDPAEVAQGRPTVYDTWVKNLPDKVHANQPRVGTLGSGSDYTAFMHHVGIPSLDFTYTYKQDVGSYPLYHTLYETHHLVADIIDQDFLCHRSITQLWTEIARNLTESVILPMDVQWYASYLKEAFGDIQSRYEKQLEVNNSTLKYFDTAVKDFASAAELFSSGLLHQHLDTTNPLAVRRVNDQLMQLERYFIDPRGLPNRPEYNHVVFAPSESNGYASSSFAGLTDLLESVGNQSEIEKPKEWAQIKQHLSVIAYRIQSASKSLSVL